MNLPKESFPCEQKIPFFTILSSERAEVSHPFLKALQSLVYVLLHKYISWKYRSIETYYMAQNIGFFPSKSYLKSILNQFNAILLMVEIYCFQSFFKIGFQSKWHIVENYSSAIVKQKVKFTLYKDEVSQKSSNRRKVWTWVLLYTLQSVYMSFTQHFAAISLVFNHFLHTLFSTMWILGNVNMGFSKSLMPTNSLQITPRWLMIWQTFWHLWFGKPHTHISPSPL